MKQECQEMKENKEFRLFFVGWACQGCPETGPTRLIENSSLLETHASVVCSAPFARPPLDQLSRLPLPRLLQPDLRFEVRPQAGHHPPLGGGSPLSLALLQPPADDEDAQALVDGPRIDPRRQRTPETKSLGTKRALSDVRM